MSNFKTPGVYIKEQDAFTSSVVAVPTAVPAFLGYTEKAQRGRNNLTNVPTRVSSMGEFIELFGRGPKTKYNMVADGNGGFEVDIVENTRYYLYDSMRLFYANGGGACYIVSVGGYDYNKGVDPEDLNGPGKGLDTLVSEQEPTIVVCPDAVLLSQEDCYSLYQQIIGHCGARMRSRVAIFDVYGGHSRRNENGEDNVDIFRNNIGNNHLAFGSAYFPWLNTTVNTPGEIDYRMIENRDVLIQLLSDDVGQALFGPNGAPKGVEDPNAGKLAKAKSLIAGLKEDNVDDVIKALKDMDKGFAKGKETDINKLKDALNKKAEEVFKPKSGGNDTDPRVAKYNSIVAEINKLSKDFDSDYKTVAQTVNAVSGLYKEVLLSLRENINVLPPSAAMAGIFALVDSQEGVHKAPANVSLNAVVSPTLNITAEDQENLNVPLNGKAINAIRSFVGKGVLVWGARSLDGNSQDWRYINVRRSMIMIEQSIKNSVEAYVFEVNTARTWLKVRTSIENFLTEVWKAGTLAGATPSEAFEVGVGLGATMTPVDILEGVMRVSIKVAITRPAEFIELTFEQKMQES